MLPFRSKLIALCPACGAILPPIRGFVSIARNDNDRTRCREVKFSPDRVVVMHKTSRLEFERRRNKHLSERQLQTELSDRLGPDYEVLHKRHSAQKQNLEEINEFLQSQGISVRWRDRESYSTVDVEWADAIFAAGGDGNYLFAASKVPSNDKIVIGLNTDPSWSEGYLCLRPSQFNSLTDVLQKALAGEFPVIHRWRIRVRLGEDIIPVRALNEVFVGEKNLSHSAYYELSCNGISPEKQKSSGLLVYTGTGSTSWAYNVNKLMPFQVKRLFELAEQNGGPVYPRQLLSMPDVEEAINNVTKCFNESSQFAGDEEKMAYVVREPIVRGIFAANNTQGFSKRVAIRSLSWNATLVVDGLSPGYDFNRGAMATCELHPQDRLMTLDPNCTNQY